MSYCFGGKFEMMELNKNSFFFYVLKRGGGKIDPRNIEFMIEALKEWLPTERVENKYDADYNAGWNDCLDVLKKNLK